MRDDVHHVDCSNIDELLYELGYKDVLKPWHWKLRQKLKHCYRRQKERLELYWENLRSGKVHTETLDFLHSDLRELRYIGRSRKKCSRIRYFDKTGELKSRMFFVKLEPRGFILTEFTNDFPINGKPTKGPMTVKSADLIKVNYSLFGFRRRKVWQIQFGQTY